MLFGIGVRRGGERHMDFHYVYSAGRCWLAGMNPYVYAQFQQFRFGDAPCPFAYAPMAAPLTMAFAKLPFAASANLFAALNVACVAMLAWLAVRIEQAMPGEAAAPLLNANRPVPWLLVALVLLCPFTDHVTFMGQTTLVVLAPLLFGWILCERGRPWVGGALIGLSSMKPQFALLPALWLLLDRRWWPLVSAGVVALILAAYPLLKTGPLAVAHSWLQALGEYKHYHTNAPGFEHMVGPKSLLAAAGVTVPDLTALALLATIGLYLLRDRFDRADVLPLLLGVWMSIAEDHDYDLVVLLPLAAALWRHLRRDPAAAGVALALLLVMFVPQRLLRVGHGPAVLLHWRTPIVLAFTGWLIAANLRRTKSIDGIDGRLIAAEM